LTLGASSVIVASDPMTRSPKSTLLERLREQSEATRAAEAAARRPLESARRDISRRLSQAVQWLDEAVGYLGVIRPSVKRRFRLTDAVTFDDPRFDQGYVAFRRLGLGDSELLDHVEWQYRLVAATPAVARVGIGGVAHMEERLRTALLKYDYESEQDDKGVVRHGVFRVEPTISASVRFQPDYAREVIGVTLHNVDRFESLRLDFEPEAIGEPALEDLVNCVLGDSDRFLHLAPVALAGRGETLAGRGDTGAADDAGRGRRADAATRVDAPSRAHSPAPDAAAHGAVRDRQGSSRERK